MEFGWCRNNFSSLKHFTILKVFCASFSWYHLFILVCEVLKVVVAWWFSFCECWSKWAFERVVLHLRFDYVIVIFYYQSAERRLWLLSMHFKFSHLDALVIIFSLLLLADSLCVFRWGRFRRGNYTGGQACSSIHCFNIIIVISRQYLMLFKEVAMESLSGLTVHLFVSYWPRKGVGSNNIILVVAYMDLLFLIWDLIFNA